MVRTELAGCSPCLRCAVHNVSIPVGRFFFALLLAFAAPAAAQSAGTRLPADSAVRIGTLPNGLRYYVRRNAEPDNRAELRLVVGAGSVLEDPDQRGLAHFVEHMAFNGTRNFPEQALTDYLERVGMRFGPDINAYTSFDETVYQLTLPTDSAGILETGFDILEDWAHGVTFDSLEIEKERGVVIEEWRLRQGAGARLQDRQFPALFQGSRYTERLPIGTLESLQTFDPQDLRRFYRDWYRPDLMAVVAVGDFDPDRVERLIRSHFSGLSVPPNPRLRAAFGVPGHDSTRIAVATDPEATGTDVALYLKRPARLGGTRASYRRWLTESLASSILMSRLYERTKEVDPPLLDVGSFQGRILFPTEAFVLNASVPENGVAAGLRAVLVELRRADQHGFQPSEVEREKRELLRRAEQRYRESPKATSAGFAAEYVSNFLYGGVPVSAATDYALVQEIVPQIGVNDLHATARAWTGEGNRVVLVTAPDKSGTIVPDREELAAVVREASQAPVTAYSEEVSDAPLIDHLPPPGRVTAMRKIPEIGVTEWTLSNGVKVVLKPTDFQEDELLLAGYSPGGTSLVADDRYTDARFAAAAVQTGGVGRWDVTALVKRLAGKVASVGVELGPLNESVSGAASARDAETLFQLVHLYFTSPRRDSTAWEAYRARARETLRNRGASPEAAFADTLQATLSQNHPRARPVSAAIFDSLSLDRSLAIYRERFGDAGDFTFYLVGRLDPDSVRPLAERYLGSLPSAGRQESWRDAGIDPPEGVVRKTVRRGQEPKARTQIVFSGPVDFSRAEAYALRSLGYVLEIRLREILREDLGGTYGVGVAGTATRDPDPEFRVAIGFGTAPGRLDELTDVIWTEIARLKAEGPTPDEVAKVREAQRRSLEVQMRENGFWLGQLMTYDRYGWDPREIATAAERIARLEAETIQAAAQRYLNPERYVQVTLLPERSGEPEPSR